MMLVGWCPRGAPKPAIQWGNGCETLHVPKVFRARSRAARWKNEGPMMQGRRHLRSRRLRKQGYSKAKTSSEDAGARSGPSAARFSGRRRLASLLGRPTSTVQVQQLVDQ